MMNLQAAITKKFSWTDYRDLGFSILDLCNRRGRPWLEFCQRYKDMMINCYSNYALIQLAERSGQILVPVAVSYSRFYIEIEDGKGYIMIDMPNAPLVYTVLDNKHFSKGDIEVLARAISAGGGIADRIVNGRISHIN